ncbi:mannonate dehydratase [Cyclobacterium amurskyense]|uniref:mannonate dehydratase n=1 Tax=Cyclobacterium amurskyense TaxID=320787 RepID=A0A0H4PGY0_9BACT|nr:mannonate dehydratase [Cyclobacterium amurskyense]AKP53439.1 Mannonate dehydratase [Cyclobacterium amurskyense]|tara:strand:- start:50175 stop:51335 length:1161 start_codon:yes stop_codon:yes gene_type:complete
MKNFLKTLQRRKFMKLFASGTAGALTTATVAIGADRSASRPSSIKAQAAKKVLMKVGCQSGGTSEENLAFKARHGVYNMDGGMPKFVPGKGWDLEDSLRKREACEKFGISLDAYHLPLTSAGIDRVVVPNIMLGKSPERDKEIEMIQQMIQVSAKTGVKLLNYNTTILPVLRTGRTIDPMRGNASYSTWNYEEALKREQPLTVAGDVDADEIFERIAYLLDRIVPVAEEYKVQLGNHIADPPVPDKYKGIMRWNSPEVFEGMKRFAKLSDSPYHGFNFCIGSIAEGLRDPKNDIFPIIEYFGKRKQIFNVHLRNIKGNYNNFQEVFPDNGEMNFFHVMRALRDVEFDGMVMPDHVPTHEAEGASSQAFSFAYGHIIGILQALKDEA